MKKISFIIVIIVPMFFTLTFYTSARSQELNCNNGTHTRAYCLVSWSPVDNRIAIRIQDTVEIWNADLTRKLATLDLDNNAASVIEWSADGHYLAMMNGTFTLFLWDSNTSELSIQNYHDAIKQQFTDAGLQGTFDTLFSLSWRSDSKAFAFTHDDSLSYLDLNTLETIVLDMQPYDARDSARLVTWAEPKDEVIMITVYGVVHTFSGTPYQLTSSHILPLLDLGGGWPTAQSIIYLGDERVAFPARQSIIEDGMLVDRKAVVAIYDLGDMKLESLLDLGAEVVNSIAWNSKENLLAVGIGDWLYQDDALGSVQIWDLSDFTHVESIDYETPVFSLDWSYDGSQLAISTVNGNISLLHED